LAFSLLHKARALTAGFQWNWIGFALSSIVVVVSILVLVHILAGINPAKVWEHVQAMPAGNIARAVFFIAAAYATLTCYDLFALRTIGIRHVPYRVAALASFTSYAIGHNIGATAFSGGAIRYRIYSQFGLTVVDVAKVCFLTGLTFWLGNLAVLGTGMIFHPQAPGRILELPPDFVRALGIVALVLLVAYVSYAARNQRSIGIKDWRVNLPSGRSTLVQVGIAVVDLGCSSLAMWSLMPAASNGATGIDGFFTVAVAFPSATLLGFASHAPGSLGVFDAAMLLALPQIGKEELVAGLLLFRALYFMVPFAVALLTMGFWEASHMFRRGSP
jgi:glycosyltransferase 2 family protein